MDYQQAIDSLGYINTVCPIKGASLFCHATIMSEVKTCVKDRDTKERFNGVIQKMTDYSGGLVGEMEYKSAVNNALVKEGKEPNFEPEKARGRHSVANHTGLSQSDKDDEQYYMTFFFTSNTKIATQYFLNGEKVDVSDIPNVLPLKYDGATQGGLDKKVIIRTPKLESIKYLKCGKIEIGEKQDI